MDNSKQKLSTTEARQGSPRMMNLRVLVGSLLLAVIVGLVLYGAYFNAPHTEREPPQQTGAQK